jgi:hypothetical protein
MLEFITAAMTEFARVCHPRLMTPKTTSYSNRLGIVLKTHKIRQSVCKFAEKIKVLIQISHSLGTICYWKLIAEEVSIHDFGISTIQKFRPSAVHQAIEVTRFLPWRRDSRISNAKRFTVIYIFSFSHAT